MSATVLRDNTRVELQRQIDDHAEGVVSAHAATLDWLRYTQGVVFGLRAAMAILNQNYRDMHG